MGRIKKYFKDKNFNLRERANIYAGAIGGTLLPIAATKYLITKGITPESWEGEALAWGISTLVNLIPITPAPIAFLGFVGGLSAGTYEANKLKHNRLEKKVKRYSNNQKPF